MRPQIKRAFPIYWLGPDVVRIGAQQGITKELTDPLGELRVLLPLLDGSREAEDVVQEMVRTCSHLAEDDVRRGIQHLDESGLIEDAAAYDDIPIRLAANQTFFAAAAPDSRAAANSAQHVLSDAHVVLLGLGGGGSASLPQLLGAGLRKLTILDYDVVEESNLNRQTLFRTSDVGRKKTSVAAEYCRAFAPDCDIEVVDLKITAAAEIVRIARGADSLICAIDEPRFIAQRRANSAAVELGIPLVVMLTQHTTGRFFSVHPGLSGCLDCLHIFDEFRTEGFLRQFHALMRPDRDAATAAISPHIQRLTSFGVDEAIRLMTGYAELLGLGKQMEVNYISGGIRSIMEWEQAEGCPTCGSNDPRFAYIFEADPL